MDIRGLTIFISDVRKATDKDGQTQRIDKELAKIRKYFQNPRLKGYDRKKCISKLLYVYMLGYDIEFGHIEAVKLLTSQKYSEKHMGYLACSILLNEKHEMLTLITQQAKDDLCSHVSSRQCLALTCIGNIGGREQAESLVDDVQRVLVGNDTTNLVRKKAALCLCRLYRIYPELLPPDAWSPRLIQLLSSRDLGVVTALCSLLLALVGDHPKEYRACVPKVVRILVSLVINKHYLAKYLYYGIPAPWLQIKLLRLLQYYPIPRDSNIVQNLRTVMTTNIEKAQRLRALEQHKSSNRFNALHAVFFETLNVSIHYDSDKKLLVEGANILMNYIEDKDPNLRYLALDTLSRMAYSQFGEVTVVLRRKQHIVLTCLKHQDISIRRRALDVLYSLCNKDNADKIVGELLEYLPVSDYNIREELVLKIAILAEKFSGDLTWYVDVVLSLARESGDYVSDDVWYRVCQIITNRQDEALQKYAAETIFHAVSSPASHEVCAKLAAYILGEFGHLICDEDHSTPIKQFKTLCYKFETGTTTTRVILMNTFVKMFNIYPDETDLRAKIKNLFKKYRSSFSIELQQRSNEYHSLLTSGDDGLLESVCDEMPPFTARESVVVKKLMERQKAVTDQRIRAMKHHATENDDKNQGSRKKAPKMALPDQPDSESEEEEEEGVIEEEPVKPTRKSKSKGKTKARAAPPPVASSRDDDLLQMDDVPAQPITSGSGIMDIISGAADSPVAGRKKPVPAEGAMLDFFSGGGAAAAPVASAPASSVTVDDDGVSFDSAVHKVAEVNRVKLLVGNLGVAIEDANLQIRIKQEYRQQKARMGIYYMNKATTNLELDVDVTKVEEIVSEYTAVSTVLPGATVAQYFKLHCISPFSDQMSLSLVYSLPHGKVRLEVPLPVAPHKFVAPLTSVESRDKFFELWSSIDDDDLNKQSTFRVTSEGTHTAKIREFLKAGFKMHHYDEIVADQNSLVCGGTFQAQTGDHVILFRIQVNPARSACRVTSRSTSALINNTIHDAVVEQITAL